MLNDIESDVQRLHECIANSYGPDYARSLISDIVFVCGETIGNQTIKFCLSIFFKREKNLLQFLRKTLTKDEYHDCKQDLLQFLNRFIITAGKLIVPFSCEIKDTCMILFNSDKYSDVRCSTFSILSKVLEFCADNSEIADKLNVSKIVQDYFLALSSPSKLSSSIKACIYTMLGFICLHYPVVMVNYSEKVLKIFLDTLKAEMEVKGHKPDFAVIAGTLEGLNNYLNNFTHSAQEGAKYAFNIYKYCKDALLENVSEMQLKRYAMPKAALNLFIKHAEQFDEYIFDDYDDLFQRITNWTQHNNYDMKKLAYLALDSYYKQLAEMLKKQSKIDEKKCRKIFTFFITKFFQFLTEDKNLKDTVIAIKGYGAFAGPCRQFVETKDVKRMLIIIIERCEQIFFLNPQQQDQQQSSIDTMLISSVQQTNEIFDEKIYQLPAFIESLSYICNEIDDYLPEDSMEVLEKLIILAIDNYPKLIKRYNRVLSISLIRLFISIELNKAMYYKEFTSKIIYQSLIRIFSYKTIYHIQLEQQQQQQQGTIYSGNRSDLNTVTSKDYLELWLNIFNMQQYEELNTIGIGMHEKKQLIKIIYNAYIETILKIIKKLDLNAIKTANDYLSSQQQQQQSPTKQGSEDTNEFLSSNPINNLKALRPRDFDILINLVDFTRDLLINKHNELFEKWLFKFSKEIILLSSKYPFISGFYKLTTLCMKIATNIGYFKNIHNLDKKAFIEAAVEKGENEVDIDNNNTLDDTTSANNSLNYEDSSLNYEKINCFHLYKKYFKEVFIRIKQFKDELLVSALEFLLALPKELIEFNLNEAFTCLESALEFGINYLPIAENALDSLEYWLRTIKLEKLKNYYSLILSKFDNYLELINTGNNGDKTTSVAIKDLNSDSKKKLLKIHYKTTGRRKFVFKMEKKKLNNGNIYGDSSLITSGTKSMNELSDEIQFRILKIFGQLAGQMSTYLYEITTSNISKEIISWDTRLHVKFAIPFVDLKPTIYFDTFMPRIIYLALNSTNRQVKINSCELLHAIIVYIIGKSVTDPVAIKTTTQPQQKQQHDELIMDRIYQHIYPAIFHLACDVEKFVRDLFQTLVMQMIHWFTGNRKFESKETIILLDCIIDCLIDDKNALLRDFSAIALKEFLKWSIKHTPISKQLNAGDSTDGQTSSSLSSSINVKSILKRLYNLLTHPSSSKRLGGVLAWNSIYMIFREEEILVNLYIFELFYYLIECLALCEHDDKMAGTQEQCKLALDHCERIIRVKRDLLNQFNAKRVKPYGWSEAVIEVAVRWLLRQCGRVETECRHKSMELVYKLAPCIRNTKDAKEYFQSKFKTDGELYFVQRFEGTLVIKKNYANNLKHSLSTFPTLVDLLSETLVQTNSNSDGNSTSNEHLNQFPNLIKIWLSMLIAPLDCYLWVFNERLLTAVNLLSTNKTIVWKSIVYFVDKIALYDLNEIYLSLYSNSDKNAFNREFLFTPSEIEDYRKHKCTLIVRLIDFLTTIINSLTAQDENLIPNNVWSTNLFIILVKTCLDPQSIGFNINDIEIYTNLPQIMQNFLSKFQYQASKLNYLAKLKEKFQLECLNLIEKEKKFQKINDLIEPKSLEQEDIIDWFKLTQLVNGYEQLNEFNIYKFSKGVNRKLFNYLFETSTKSSTIKISTSELQATTNRNEVLNDNLTCLEAKTKLFNLILCLNQTQLDQDNDYLIEILDQYLFKTDSSSIKINDFFHIYKNEIYINLCKRNDYYIKYLLSKLKINFKRILQIFLNLIDYLTYQQQNLDKQLRKQYLSKISSNIYTNWVYINDYIIENDKSNNSNKYIEEKLFLINLLIKLLVIDIPKELSVKKHLFNVYTYLLNDQKTDLSFKCKLLDMLYFFSNLKPSSTNVISTTGATMTNTSLEFDFSIKTHIEKFIMNNFPLKSSELIETSALYTDYINAVKKLLISLELSLSFDLAQLIIMIYIREKQHICEIDIKKSLISYLKRLDFVSATETGTNKLQFELINYYWNSWFNLDINQLERKLILFKNIILNFLENCNKQIFIDFLCQNLYHIIQIMDQNDFNFKMNTIFDIACKRSIFELIELAYKRLAKDEIFSQSSKLCQAYEKLKFNVVKDGKEFTKEIIRKARKYLCNVINEDNNEHVRLLQCSAYNCLTALFIRTQTEPKLYYACLFKDDLAKSEYIFEPLIDKVKIYKFDVELENLEQRKTRFISLRNEMKEPNDGGLSTSVNYISSVNTSTINNPLAANSNGSGEQVNYLNSQNIYESSLSEELSAFDFTSNAHAKQLAASFQASQNMTGTLPITMQQTQSTQRKITAASLAGGIRLGDNQINDDTIEIDLDDLNQHESMASYIELIESLVKNRITPIYDKDQMPTEMPPWLQFIHRKISDYNTHENVKLFLIRGIINTKNVFKSYAKFLYTPLISFIVNSTTLCSDGYIDYFTLDLMVLLLSWHTFGIPESSDRKIVNKLFEKLMKNCYHDNRPVLKNNLELLKTMTECWKPLIEVPAGIINTFLQSNDEAKQTTGVQLFGVVLANDVQNYDFPGSLKPSSLYEALIKCCSQKSRKIYPAAAEVTGMLLRYLESKKETSSQIQEDYEYIIELIFKILRSLEQTEFITCVYRIQLNFKQISERFLNKLVFHFPQFHGEMRLLCGEAILAAASKLEDAIYTKSYFFDMIRERDSELQLICLKIVFELIDKINDNDILKLLPSICSFTSHTNAKCRLQVLNILMTLFDKHVNLDRASDISAEILDMCKNNLLKFLTDTEPQIRLTAFNFWTDKAYLSHNTIDRIVSILNKMYSPETEYEYLSYSTDLLLEKTSKSPDFNRLIYEQPLTSCTFRELNLSLDWRRRHEIMTPLFVETMNTFDSSMDNLSQIMSSQQTGELTTQSQQQNFQLRATQQQSLQFQPTQQVESAKGPYDWLTQSSLDTYQSNLINLKLTESQSALLFNINKRQDLTTTAGKIDDADRDIYRLRRRFLREDKSQSRQWIFAQKNIKDKEKEEEEKRKSSLKLSNKVKNYRHYRIGDFPDIQIKYFELITPLQALAQRDPKIAMFLFNSLFVSILSEIHYMKDENDTNEIIGAIEVNLNNMLEKSDHYNPNFIACIIEIAIKHSSYFQLNTNAVTDACLNSSQQSLGIILLEEYIIKNEIKSKKSSNDLMPTAAKRIKLDDSNTNTSNNNSDELNLWFQLAKLYRSINDYDSIKGIFKHNINLMTKYTREAFEYESNCDYFNALNCYMEAIDKDWKLNEQPLDIEQELWDQSILRCCDQLTDWKQMCEFSTRDTNLTELFMDSYACEYEFPYAFRSKLKLILQSEEIAEQKKHQDLIDFIEKLDSTNKQYIEEGFCQELALIYLHQKDYNACKYYAQLSVEKYLKDWSNINKTLIKARLTKLQSLQSIIELNEFLKFIDTTDNTQQQINEALFLKTKITKQIDLWLNTMPNKFSDPPRTWDDIITNRCIYFEFIEDKFNLNQEKKMLIDDDDDEDMRNLIETKKILFEDIEKTKVLMKLQFANAAYAQGNYKLALNKLQQTHFILKNDDIKLDDLKLEWMHCYLHTHLGYSLKQFNKPEDGIVNILQMSTLTKLIQYDKVSKSLVATKHNDLYRNHNIIHSKFCKFILNSFMNIDDLNEFMNKKLKMDKKLFNQLYSYTKCDGGNALTEEQFCTKPELAATNILKRGFDCLSEINYDLQGSLEMAKYCDYFLRLRENERDETNFILSDATFIKDEYPVFVVKQLLNAIKFGSYEARERFPRLLQIVELYSNTVLKTFIEESADIPCWMFLGWISQMTALLDKKEAKAVHKIIENMASTYPQALVYPFKMSYDSFKFDDSLKEEKDFAHKIHKAMNRIPLVNEFISSLEQLTNPDLLCKDYLNSMCMLLQSSKNRAQVIKNYKEMYSNLFDCTVEAKGSIQSSQESEGLSNWGKIRQNFSKLFKKSFDDEFGVNGEKMKTLSDNDIQSKLRALSAKLQNCPTMDGNIGDYSPWLKAFKRNPTTDLEIPGQYTSKTKPLLEYHVKIDSFDERVTSLSSIRKPKLIIIRGNDEKEYKFLVKGGEDQRQDQRIEMLFGVINELLHADSHCYQRNLSIRTYKVVPMTDKVALIEWLNNTRTLKEVIYGSLTDDETKAIGPNRPNLLYQKYIESASKGVTAPKTNADLYGQVYIRYTRDQVCEKFSEIQNALPWDLLRRYIRSMSNSTEGFFLLRNQFIVSYAVASICQYILGIGDRHLSNWMIDTKTGEAVAIDFGMAFGHATIQLPIPELMPIRLTRQILKLIAPLEQNGIFEASMLHTLRALRDNNDLLLCMLDVFIKEPSVDWIGHARRIAKKNQNEETDFQIGVSYAQDRVKSAKNKLLGINPCVITRNDLISGTLKDGKYINEFLNTACGLNAIDKDGNYLMERTRILNEKKKNYYLTLEEQVRCIIEQSIDPDILGRTWNGWEPYI